MTNSKKIILYKEAGKELEALLSGETDAILKMATINCVLKYKFPHFFWVGFYLAKNNTLSVGPYQGSLGCLHIVFGRGVCGAAAERQETVVVSDVHKFPGHIACDSRSQSEIVVPVFDEKKKLIAVFDVDSDQKKAFNKIDREYLEKILNWFFTNHDEKILSNFCFSKG